MKRLIAICRERPELPLSVLLFIVVVGGWELTVRIFEIPKIILPTPSSVAVAMWTGMQGDMLMHFGITFYEVLAGFVLGSLFGLILGALIGQFPLLERTLYPYVVAFQTLPKVAIAPLIVIWFGYGVTSKIVITATIAFFPLLANTIVGLRAAPVEQIELMVAFTASRWQIFKMARFPQALPYIFVGLDVAIVLSVIGAIVGEFVGAQAGLGYLILQRNFNMDMAGVFAILIVLSMMGIGLHMIVNAVQKRVVFWMESGADKVIGA
ncbi:MAG: ABC transporter permease [Betaproteobacteria bacterium]|nr:ABC transporter permease [Betaproteobacteria bacterium]